jgi:hypothetical protein
MRPSASLINDHETRLVGFEHAVVTFAGKRACLGEQQKHPVVNRYACTLPGATMRWWAEMVIMITVDATLDISGMASGECMLPEVDASGSTVREPFVNSAALMFGEALVSTLLTRSSLLPTAPQHYSHLLQLVSTMHRVS